MLKLFVAKSQLAVLGLAQLLVELLVQLLAARLDQETVAQRQQLLESYRVSVQLDNGSMRSYDTSSYGELRIGDRVRIENGQLSRTM